MLNESELTTKPPVGKASGEPVVADELLEASRPVPVDLSGNPALMQRMEYAQLFFAILKDGPSNLADTLVNNYQVSLPQAGEIQKRVLTSFLEQNAEDPNAQIAVNARGDQEIWSFARDGLPVQDLVISGTLTPEESNRSFSVNDREAVALRYFDLVQVTVSESFSAATGNDGKYVIGDSSIATLLQSALLVTRSGPNGINENNFPFTSEVWGSIVHPFREEVARTFADFCVGSEVPGTKFDGATETTSALALFTLDSIDEKKITGFSAAGERIVDKLAAQLTKSLEGTYLQQARDQESRVEFDMYVKALASTILSHWGSRQRVGVAEKL